MIKTVIINYWPKKEKIIKNLFIKQVDFLVMDWGLKFLTEIIIDVVFVVLHSQNPSD